MMIRVCAKVSKSSIVFLSDVDNGVAELMPKDKRTVGKRRRNDAEQGLIYESHAKLALVSASLTYILLPVHRIRDHFLVDISSER